MTTYVKICGITDFADASFCADAGADALGFNFYAKSPRFVDPQQVRVIIENLDGAVDNVGVFVNSPISEISEVVEITGINVVQLHGSETEELIAGIRTVLPQRTRIIRVLRSFGSSCADAVLVDTDTKDHGGSGMIADWAVAAELVAGGNVVYLAGGLDETNVRDAIEAVRPFAVDACSRLESTPGRKDHKRVAEFIRVAKKAL